MTRLILEKKNFCFGVISPEIFGVIDPEILTYFKPVN